MTSDQVLYDLLLPGLRVNIGTAVRFDGCQAYDDWRLIEERCRVRLALWVANLPVDYRLRAAATFQRIVAEEMQP